MTAPALSPRMLLAREVCRAESELNLGKAALLIAQEEYPQLSVELYLARLDQIAEEVRDRLANETAPLVVLDDLISTLFVRRGFRGNRESYYDPRNSFLNDVLDRAMGIPITLGVVLLEVGWRLDLPLEGVNFPGHFLVRYKGDTLDLLVDPYEAGKTRFEDQAQECLDRVYGGMVRIQESFLRRASKVDILTRMLTNLKGVYVNVNDNERALSVVERLLLIAPTAPTERRFRGILLARLGRRAEAAEQLEEYLRITVEPADAHRVMSIIEGLRSGRDLTDELAAS